MNLQEQFAIKATQGFNSLVSAGTGIVKSALEILPTVECLSITQVEQCLSESVDRCYTGLSSVDELFQENRDGRLEFGFRQKDIIVLAGMSGIGKTTLAFTIFTNLYQQNKNPMFFSLDMRKDQTWTMFKNAYCGFSATNKQFIYEMRNKQKPIIFTHGGDLPVQSIKNSLLAYPDTTVVFIDYIDYLIPTKSNVNTMINFKNLMSELKLIANECNVALVILSQSTEDKMYNAGRPTLANLYGGKAVRSAVDHVIAVYRNSKHNSTLSQEFKYVTEVIGLKLRSNAGEHKAYVNFENGKMIDLDEAQIFAYKNTQ